MLPLATFAASAAAGVGKSIVDALGTTATDTAKTAASAKARKTATVQHTMLRRMARPEDIAETIFFLAAGAAYITGETITVDGGAI